MGTLIFEATAPEIATISAALNLVPQEWRIDVLLFINKLIAKHTAHTRLCPYQNNCHFQKHCWYKHQTPNTHNPYAPSPHFSLRNNVQRNGEFTLQGNSDTKTTAHDLSQTGTLIPSASTAPGPSIYRSHYSPPPPLTPSAAPQVKKTSRASSPENSSRSQSNLITEANDDDQFICTSPTQKSASGTFASQENSMQVKQAVRLAKLEAGLQLTINAIAFRFEPAVQASKENRTLLAKTAARVSH